MSCRKLEVRDLVVELAPNTPGHAPKRLVDSLSFSVSGGESLAIIGESGAGKSMTSLAILNLLPTGIRQTSGTVLVNDRDVGAMSREERRLLRCREIGVIMQNPMSAFDPVFTVYSHFSETLAANTKTQPKKTVRQRAMAAIEEVGLDVGVLDAYPFQLSGGMLQRIMIALALLHDPEYLIADEPTTDLDVVSQKVILDLLRDRCAARHLGLLIITHDLSVAAYMAGTALIMQNGRAVDSGVIPTVFSHPGHPYTRELVEAHTRLYSERYTRLAAAADEQ